jgi:hypothetical protein
MDGNQRERQKQPPQMTPELATYSMNDDGHKKGVWSIMTTAGGDHSSPLVSAIRDKRYVHQWKEGTQKSEWTRISADKVEKKTPRMATAPMTLEAPLIYIGQ